MGVAELLNKLCLRALISYIVYKFCIPSSFSFRNISAHTNRNMEMAPSTHTFTIGTKL